MKTFHCTLITVSGSLLMVPSEAKDALAALTDLKAVLAVEGIPPLAQIHIAEAAPTVPSIVGKRPLIDSYQGD